MASAPRFLGLARTTLDSKNRITIPAKFRSKLPAGSDGKFVLLVMPGAGFRHLELFDQVNGEQRVERLTVGNGLPGVDERQREVMLAHVEEVELDAQGRLLLPAEHIQFAKLKGEVVVSGAGSHIKVYDAQEAAGFAPVSVADLDPAKVAAIFDKANSRPAQQQ
ncbi:MAG: hypothetical protein IT463_00995 [Planctomycetes bacterium]|nr:hypothetical protein [Planctomycetota bacterium]